MRPGWAVLGMSNSLTDLQSRPWAWLAASTRRSTCHFVQAPGSEKAHHPLGPPVLGGIESLSLACSRPSTTMFLNWLLLGRPQSSSRKGKGMSSACSVQIAMPDARIKHTRESGGAGARPWVGRTGA